MQLKSAHFHHRVSVLYYLQPVAIFIDVRSVTVRYRFIRHRPSAVTSHQSPVTSHPSPVTVTRHPFPISSVHRSTNLRMTLVYVIHSVSGVEVKEGRHRGRQVRHVVGHVLLSDVVENLVLVVVGMSEELGRDSGRKPAG